MNSTEGNEGNEEGRDAATRDESGDSSRVKVAAIFRELVGERADRLNGGRYLADVNSRITSALVGNGTDADVLRSDQIGFHLVDWQAEAAFIVALVLYPERFTDEEIEEGIRAFLVHVPAHVVTAARLAGYPSEPIPGEEAHTA